MTVSILQVDKIQKNNSSVLTLVNPSIQGYLGIPYGTTVSYVITDTDNYSRIACDTTSGDITVTLPLKGNNVGRRIEIANVKGGTNKVIISPNATDANKLSNDGLNVLWLPKVGDYVVFQEDSTSGFWEIVNERISSQLRLTAIAGNGSTDTHILRFTNSIENYGNMFGENHSTGYTSNQKGLEIAVNRSGRYSISFSTASFNVQFGLSLNSTQLTTNISDSTTADILGRDFDNNYSTSMTWVGYLKKGDIVRPHSNNTGGTSLAWIAVTYLG